ncbi:MAG: ECF-type sigma factor [Proteobacteria bacterium]|nr:ECF-type sigma factor [Pseudomonadota bacterium]
MSTSADDPRSPRGPDSLIHSLYDELRQLARARIQRLQPGQTLQPTELVHEVYARLVKDGKAEWDSRGQFFAAAARAMRNFLVDRARHKGAIKRGGDQIRVDVSMRFLDGQRTLSAEQLLWLHSALDALHKEHPERAQIVLLHCFAGLSIAEIAELMATSKSTIERRWRFARAWMYAHHEEP